MSKKKRKPADWEEARKRCGLNDDDIRMATELGMTAASLIRNIPARSQMWKLPVKEWLRQLYEERRLAEVRHETDSTYLGDSEFSLIPYDGADDWSGSLEPVGKRNSEELRIAGVYVARQFSLLPEVVRVVLFGSVQASAAMSSTQTNECRDVDLAVWLTDLSRLRAMQNARREALNRLLALREISVEPSHVDVHIFEPGSNRYRGRLCSLGMCPKPYMDACLVDGCGVQPYLRQLVDYRHDRYRFAQGNGEVLFERSGAGTLGGACFTEITDEDLPF